MSIFEQVPDVPDTWDESRVPQCEFGMCRREAELELLLSAALDPVQVCGLHVSPVLSWGIPHPHEPEQIRYLWNRPESAA